MQEMREGILLERGAAGSIEIAFAMWSGSGKVRVGCGRGKFFAGSCDPGRNAQSSQDEAGASRMSRAMHPLCIGVMQSYSVQSLAKWPIDLARAAQGPGLLLGLHTLQQTAGDPIGVGKSLFAVNLMSVTSSF